MPQQLSPLNDAERAWVESNLVEARLLLRACGQPSTGPFDAYALDEAFAVWAARTRAAGADPNAGINTFGIAFGQHLVQRLGFVWVVVTDEHGTELAVVGQPGDITLFPANLVAKRYVSGATGFLAPIAAETAALVAGGEAALATAAAGAAAKRPWWKVW